MSNSITLRLSVAVKLSSLAFGISSYCYYEYYCYDCIILTEAVLVDLFMDFLVEYPVEIDFLFTISFRTSSMH